MTRIRNFAEITPNLRFTEYNFYEEFRGSFEKTELGRMKKILALREMAESLKLVNKSMMPKRGQKSYFTPEGKVALNGNVFYQMFCDIVIDPAHRAGQGSEERGVWGHAFNEGTRLAHCIKMHRRLFGVDVQKGKKAKARLKMTEILYIFFGIHTANAVELPSRIAGLQPATR